MLVIAHHNISNPEGFWADAEKVSKNSPGDLKLHGVYPTMDGKKQASYFACLFYMFW